jgi:5-formyltetrahydrofolate cyclo-ligase
LHDSLSSSLLRKKTLIARDGLHPQERQVMSEIIIQKLFHLQDIIDGETLFIYVDFRSEVETRLCITALLKMGKRVVVPVTLAQEKRLLPVAIRNISRDLSPGYCGIPEPLMDIRKSQVVAGSEIETIIVPGSVFDERGGRLGYGGGYYDRFMALEAPLAKRIGLAFDLQVFNRLTLQPHDEMLDLIVTEKRIIKGVRNPCPAGVFPHAHNSNI